MANETEAPVIDPVCGMHLSAFAAPCRIEHRSGTHYFCGEECRSRFEQEPARFASVVERETVDEEAGEPIAAR
jgi:YHS domain-containing protein